MKPNKPNRFKMKFRIKNWGKYGIEFLSVFVAVISAFALTNWNDNRKDHNAEEKTLTKITMDFKRTWKIFVITKLVIGGVFALPGILKT